MVVAGAGLGGLFAAAKLAKEGKKVVLLEKHNIPGGYASTFKRKGYTFEASLHALDGFFPTQEEKEIHRVSLFEEFGLISNLNFFELPELYALESNTFNITVPASYEMACSSLLEKFPEDEKTIRHFFNKVKKVYDQMMLYARLGWKAFLILPFTLIACRDLISVLRTTLGAYLDKLTDNEELKIALASNTHYYHDDPYNYNFVHFCAGQGGYWGGGAAFLQGGSFAISKYMAKFIANNGGKIIYNASVEETLISDNQIQGVVYKDLKTDERHTIKTSNMIANLPFPVLVDTLPEPSKSIINSKFTNFKKSNSLFSVYFGLKKPLKNLGSDKYTLLLLPEEFTTLASFATVNNDNDYSKRIIDLTDYSILPEYSDPEKPICTAVVIDSIDAWENLSADEYKEKKERHTQELIEKLEKRFPGFKDNVAYYEAATPKTFERYTSNPGGVVYGFSQDVNQLGPQRPQLTTAIKGLYLASAWTAPGGGMAPVSKSGYKAAVQILKKG